jgi:hypothetical protein
VEVRLKANFAPLVAFADEIGLEFGAVLGILPFGGCRL